MHPKEARKIRNGTGRLSHLALKNSEILIGVDFSDDPRIEELLSDSRYFPLILYPGKTSKEIGKFLENQKEIKERIPLVFIIDGTWKATRKMMKLSCNLHVLPRVFIQPQSPSRFLIKHQPHRLCLSTIESLYFLLTALNDAGLENLDGRHKVLLDVLDRLVNIQLSHIENSGIRRDDRRDSSPKIARLTSKKPHKSFPFFR